MKRFSAIIFIFLVANLFAPSSLYAQNRKTLEQNKKKLEEEIQYNKKLLQQTQKDKNVSEKQLIILKDQITKREKLITTINREISAVNNDINTTEATIIRLNSEIKSLKAEYAKIVQASFRNRSQYDRLTFIFSSDDFNQAFRRIKYFEQYSAYRKNQVRLIENKEIQLEQTKQTLVTTKQSKSKLLKSEEKEKQQLSAEEKNKNELVNSLKKKEKDLRSTIQKKEKESQKLQSMIQKIIDEEIRKAQEEARKREEARRKQEAAEGKTPTTKPTTPSKTTTFALTPEEQKLSDNFGNNKGKLPWPTERGVISGRFGEHEHPALKGVMVNNFGVDIMTNNGANARAVFDGVVSRIFTTPKETKAIIVRHGDYLTVYSNLSSVNVSQGQKISTKQMLGRIATDDDKTELQFQIWKGTTKMNPEYWISQGK